MCCLGLLPRGVGMVLRMKGSGEGRRGRGLSGCALESGVTNAMVTCCVLLDAEVARNEDAVC